jgi:hypothetical protein
MGVQDLDREYGKAAEGTPAPEEATTETEVMDETAPTETEESPEEGKVKDPNPGAFPYEAVLIITLENKSQQNA